VLDSSPPVFWACEFLEEVIGIVDSYAVFCSLASSLGFTRDRLQALPSVIPVHPHFSIPFCSILAMYFCCESMVFRMSLPAGSRRFWHSGFWTNLSNLSR